MIVEHEGDLTILKPGNGFKYVTNGETWSDLVYLGTKDNIENWHDTNEEPPEPTPEPPEEATDEDYKNALAELGVKI